MYLNKSQATDDLQMEVEAFLNDIPLLVNRLNIKCLACHRLVESEVACKYSLVYCGNCYFVKTGTKRPRSIRPSIQIAANPIQIAINPIHIAKNAKSSKLNTPNLESTPSMHAEVQNMEFEHAGQNELNGDASENLAQNGHENGQENEHQVENAHPQNAIEFINLSSASENEHH
ncbi:hypothetical protein M3Y97_00691000 [Aphelenchoides bicaudatus]|nr:hypothetical protein M3Y97_00691000 [Aphelenchoides bicaudatus]